MSPRTQSFSLLFKESMNNVLPFLKEATAKERAMMSNKLVSGNKNFVLSSSQTSHRGLKRNRDATEAVNGPSPLIVCQVLD